MLTNWSPKSLSASYWEHEIDFEIGVRENKGRPNEKIHDSKTIIWLQTTNVYRLIFSPSLHNLDLS